MNCRLWVLYELEWHTEKARASSITWPVMGPSSARSASSVGWLAGEVVLPLVDLDVQLASGIESRACGFGDLTVGPGLQWAPRKFGNGVFVQRVMIDVGVPAGKYSDSCPVNIGNHLVVVDPDYAFTYERRKVEFSARLHYL
jgi:hypothetical protein